MITRTHRFHGHNSLRYVYQHGRTVRDTSCAMRYALNQRRTTYRAAVVVSRKVHKSAVVRNRIRRRLYEVLRGYEANIQGPYDLVFTVFSDQINELTPTQLDKVVHAQLQKSGILSPSGAQATDKPLSHGIVVPRKS